MKIKIRNAQKKDINAIIKLEKELADYHAKIDKYYRPGSKERNGFKKYLNNALSKKNIKILIVDENKNPIRFFICWFSKSPGYIFSEKIGEIGMAFIKKEYRRRRLGEKAIKEIIGWFKKNKIKNIETNVDIRNKIGFGAWKKFGFEEYMKKMKLEL